MNFASDSDSVEVILYGGLGNQLFQYAAALSAAIESDLEVRVSLAGETRSFNSKLPDLLGYQLPLLSKRPLISRKQSVLEKDVIRVLLMISNSENSSFLIVKARNLISIFLKRFLKIRTKMFVSMPSGLGFDPDFVCDYSRCSLLGNFHSYRWISPAAKKILFDNLKPVEASLIIEDYVKLAEEEKPTAVHIRLGDYLDIEELNIIDRDYFDRALEYLGTVTNNRILWIFTNDEVNFHRYLSTNVGYKIRVIPNSLSPVETLEDMRLCDNHIISNSTFSWWGAFLGLNQAGTVIAPLNWFKSRKDPKDICPPDWVRL